MNKLKPSLKTVAALTGLAGSLLLGGSMVHKAEAREFRMSLLEQAQATELYVFVKLLILGR